MSFAAELQALVNETRMSSRERPTPPTPPTAEANKGQAVGTVGTVGRDQAPKPRRAPSPEDLEDAFEERAAILQFDAHFSRREAERRAREEQRKMMEK